MRTNGRVCAFWRMLISSTPQSVPYRVVLKSEYVLPLCSGCTLPMTAVDAVAPLFVMNLDAPVQCASIFPVDDVQSNLM